MAKVIFKDFLVSAVQLNISATEAKQRAARLIGQHAVEGRLADVVRRFRALLPKIKAHPWADASDLDRARVGLLAEVDEAMAANSRRGEAVHSRGGNIAGASIDRVTGRVSVPASTGRIQGKFDCAYGQHLDTVAELHGVKRKGGEPDEMLRRRLYREVESQEPN